MAKILVIDDDHDIATTTRIILEEGKHTVEVELDDNRALAHVNQMKPDLIVLDVMFPADSDAGFKLARSIHGDYPKMPIIMVTSVNQHSSLKFSNKDISENWLPVTEFVEKPVKKEQLLALVDRLLKST